MQLSKLASIILFFITLFFTVEAHARQCESHSETAPISPIFESLLSAEPGCDALHFTSDGLIGELAKNGSSTLSVSDISILLDSKRDLRTDEVVRRFIIKKLPDDTSFNALKSKKNLFDGYIDTLNSKSRETLLKLQAWAVKNNLKTIDLDGLRHAADATLQQRQKNGLSSCYFIYTKKSLDREVPSAHELRPQVQQQIERLFQRGGQHFSMDKEIELLNDGELNGDEVTELRALRLAVHFFENDSILKDRKGGWSGNIWKPSKVSAWCGEQARTYEAFIQQLIKDCLVKHFEVVPGVLVRSEWLGLNNHSAVLLRNRRTNQLFVHDAWFEDGGNAARLLTVEDWLKKNDKINAVDLPASTPRKLTTTR